ncbi:dynein heavy chain [Coemansia guatemalensis]|uniref:Dynein heavy chain n=1 Tax=Coemansia guatemalensis TaxID=2761395 RepID=A0A9W8I2M6_9FUNG|nr:dynein heavy chain [Coemansia guatemalensis]
MLVERIAQTPDVAEELQRSDAPIWLGGLLAPEAFITATRQAVAKQLACSLEELQLNLVLHHAEGAFAVSGLRIEGAAWSAANPLVLNDGSHESLPTCFLTWSLGASLPSDTAAVDLALVPVYLNRDRDSLMFVASLPIDLENGATPDAVTQRAVAIVAA